MSFCSLLPQDFPLRFIIIISSLPPQLIMAPQSPLQGGGGTESSRTTGASSNTPPTWTQQQHSHHLVHHNAENAATENMTLDPQLTIVRKTGSSRKRTQHVIGCKCSRIEVHGRQLMIWHTDGVRRELRDQFIAACYGKPSLSTQAFALAIRKIEHHDVVSTVISANESGDKNPREWTNQPLITSQDATEAYKVEVIADSNM